MGLSEPGCCCMLAAWLEPCWQTLHGTSRPVSQEHYVSMCHPSENIYLGTPSTVDQASPSMWSASWARYHECSDQEWHAMSRVPCTNSLVSPQRRLYLNYFRSAVKAAFNIDTCLMIGPMNCQIPACGLSDSSSPYGRPATYGGSNIHSNAFAANIKRAIGIR